MTLACPPYRAAVMEPGTANGKSGRFGLPADWPNIQGVMRSPVDQQPISRTVGRRQPRRLQPLTAADRAAMTCMAQYTTRTPKGVFRYRSAAEMDADRLRWTVAAVAARKATTC